MKQASPSKRILITGAAGRIGRTLSAAFTDGFDLRLTDIVVPEDHPQAPHIIARNLASDDLGPLCDQIDAIIHLAGHPNSRDWDVVETDNVRASRRLIEAAGAANVPRFVFASSLHVAGFLSARAALVDDAPYLPDSPYGVSKAAVEMMLRYAVVRYGMDVCALRICSFRERPSNARELVTWISPGDTVRLFDSALRSEFTGFLAAWGISRNQRANLDSDAWRQLGYFPQDDAEAFVDRLLVEGVTVDCISEWQSLGGAFAKRSEDQDQPRA